MNPQTRTPSLVVVLTQLKDGRVHLKARSIPADPTEPRMVAVYANMADALDQVDWMAARGVYRGRLGPDYFVAVSTELREEK